MFDRIGRVSIAVLLLAVVACGEIEHGCEPQGAVTPICGIQMPEDLVALPGAGGLLIAEYGDGGALHGDLIWFQPEVGSEFIPLVDSNNITQGADHQVWGEADCPVPDKLSPHGIHLSQRGQVQQLLVVNHSKREHVLFYEVQPSTDPATAPRLAWRGCVLFPDDAVLNDVAALPDGGFAVTHMYKRENQVLAQVKSMLGLNKGHVWRWSPGSGMHVMANSVARMPNGIEVAADGKTIWVNNYLEQELRQYDVASEQLMATIPVPNIDNSSWLADGRLLLASHTSPLTMAPCFGLLEGSCGSPYQLVAVDTKTGETVTLFSADQGGPFGPATVAVEYQGVLYAGSFSGDRIARITLE